MSHPSKIAMMEPKSLMPAHMRLWAWPAPKRRSAVASRARLEGSRTVMEPNSLYVSLSIPVVK